MGDGPIDTALVPADEAELCAMISDAAARGGKLAIAGGGSKAGIGRPGIAATQLDMRRFSGIIDYDPAELVLTAGAATPLAEVHALLAAEGQMLAFEPFDHAPLFGRPAGAATIGGVVAAGVAGSGRLSEGGARDHLLGFEAVSGRGEHFVAGAKVVKNVTGYDLPKVAAGSWGRLFALTRLNLKVLPRPRRRVTLRLHGLDVAEAVRLMRRGLGSQAGVGAAAHYAGPGASWTVVRVQGFAESVEARLALLTGLLGADKAPERLEGADCEALWDTISLPCLLGDTTPLWRIVVPAGAGAGIADQLRAQGAACLLDWAGGLVWAATDAAADAVRSLAQAAGGHVALIRGPAQLRASVPPFHPAAPGVARLEERVRRAFDPAGVFETGRF